MARYIFPKGVRPWNYRKVEMACAYCGKTFLSPPSHEIKRRCCSVKCAGLIKRLQPATHYRCYGCKEMIAKELFNKNKSRANGLCNRCKTCQVKGNLEYRQRNRGAARAAARTYMRKHRIGNSNGKEHRRVKNKRPYPADECCELCQRHRPMKLVYHHWTDLDFSQGMWICRPCHSGVHFVERVGATKYLALKKHLSVGVSPVLAAPNHILF